MHHDASQARPDAGLLRLYVLVAQRLATPFQWGVHDCCLWAADCVLALTGRDLATGLRRTYADALGAGRLVQQLGGMQAIGARAGPEIPPMAAAVGDVGLVVLDDRQLLTVCLGAQWLAPAAHGLAARPLPDAVHAWRVERA